jgi:hypothetical protein
VWGTLPVEPSVSAHVSFDVELGILT